MLPGDNTHLQRTDGAEPNQLRDLLAASVVTGSRYGPSVLALDIATCTGWALSASGVVTSGSVDFSRYLGSQKRPPEHVGAAFLKFERWVKDRIRDDKPAMVVFEQHGHFKSAAAVGVCVGLRGVLMAAAAQYDVPVKGYAPREIKKFWAGNGNATKHDMIAATLLRTAADVHDDNESDAIALLYLHAARAA